MGIATAKGLCKPTSNWNHWHRKGRHDPRGHGRVLEGRAATTSSHLMLPCGAQEKTIEEPTETQENHENMGKCWFQLSKYEDFVGGVDL